MANELMEIEVYPYATPTVRKNVLHTRISPTFLTQLKSVGGGSFQISTHEPKLIADPTLLDYRNIMKFKVNGAYVGAMVLSGKTVNIIQTTADGEVFNVTGEGIRTWFNDAEVYPWGGLALTSLATRAFNFASEPANWYVSANWVTPTNCAAYLATSSNPWGTAPADWPDVPNAYWVWSTNSSSGAAAGNVYFRCTFTVATAATYSLFLASEQFEVYIDGQVVTQSTLATDASITVTRVDQAMTVGTHYIGIKCTNPTAGAPAALIAALFIEGDATLGTAATLVNFTGDGSGAWLVNGYPTQPPGWSAGEIMLTLISEASTRGVLSMGHLTPTFTATTDSYGNAWVNPVEWSFNIGSTYESVLEQLEGLVCDAWVDANYNFYMVAERGTDRSEFQGPANAPTVVPIVFEKGKNLGVSSVEGVGAMVNALLVQTTDGWIEVDDTSGSIGTYGRLESTLQTNLATAVSQTVAEAIFIQKADPEEGATYSIIPIGGDVPWVNFDIGDWVLAPNAIGLSVKRRVMSISATEDQAGNIVYTVEFDTVFQDDGTKITAWLSKLAGGALGGQFANVGAGTSAPVGVPTIVSPTPPPAKVPVAPTTLTASSVGLWTPDGTGTYSQITLSWAAVTTNTDGTATVPYLYEVWGHLASSSDSSYVLMASTSATSAQMQPFDPGVAWKFEVRAFNVAGAPGAFSSSYTYTGVAPTTPMSAPSTPTLSSSLGVIIVSWDGLIGGVAPPPQFRYVYAQVSTSSGGTYTRMGSTFSKASSISISGLTVGTAYWVELVGVDGSGILSTVSAYATITVAGVALGSLGSDVSAAIAAGLAAGQAAQTATNVLDPSFEANDPTIWSLETSNVHNVTTTPRTGSRALQIAATSAAYTASKYGQVITCNDGDNFFMDAWVRALGAGSTVDGGVALAVQYGPTSALGTTALIVGSPTVTTTYTEFNGTFAVPNGTRFIKPVIMCEDTGSANTYLIDDITFRPQVTSALIVNGTIQSTDIATGAILATNIGAGSIAAAAIQAGAVTAGAIAAGAVTTAALAAGAITANTIATGTITALQLAATVGNSLDISSNTSVNILAGSIASTNSSLAGTSSTLATLQTYYSFGSSGATISTPGSQYAVQISSSQISMLQNGVVVSYWTAGTMYVNSFVGTQVQLGNHIIQQYTTGTVVKALT